MYLVSLNKKTRTKINLFEKININENLPSIPGAPGAPEEKERKKSMLKRSIYQVCFNVSYLDHLFVHQHLVLLVHYKQRK